MRLPRIMRRLVRTVVPFLALGIGLTVGVEVAWAQAVTLDAASSAVDGGVSSVTWSHTIGTGAGRLLVVGVSIRGSVSVTGVTYSGQALTFVGQASQGGSNSVEIWRLVAPPVGTADVVVTLSGSANGLSGGSVSFFNVDQTTPHGAFTGASGPASTSPSVTVASAVGEVVFDTVATNGDAITLSAGAGQTEHWNLANGSTNNHVRGAGSTEPGNTSVTMSWTPGSSKSWSMGAISLKPLSPPILNISKSDAPDPVAAGANVTYTISYSNTGSADASGVVISDTLPGNTTFVYR